MDASTTKEFTTDDEMNDITYLMNKAKLDDSENHGRSTENEDGGHGHGDGGDGSGDCNGKIMTTNTATATTKSDLNALFVKKATKKMNMYKASDQPLKNPYTFWIDRSQRGVAVEEFESCLKKIYTVYTVHIFWNVMYNLPLPSALAVRSSLHLSRDERKPIWEAPYNCKGGTFRFKIPKKDTDKAWLELTMAFVGETLSGYVSAKDDVCGISVSIREREDMLLIWNANAKEAKNARIFNCVRTLLPDTKLYPIYRAHQTHQAFNKHTDVAVADVYEAAAVSNK